MNLAMLTTFAASRKEPLAAMIERVHAALVEAGFGEPHVEFVLSDSPVAGGVSSVDRVLKRLPDLKRFAQSLAPYPGAPEMKVISNRTAPRAPLETVDFNILLEIARGVPRSFPFHSIGLHFSVPAFFGGTTLPSTQLVQMPGISMGDSWWVNGRQRSLTALTIVDADSSAKKLPQLPESVASALAACGKIKKTIQVPLLSGAAPARSSLDSAAPEIAQAIRALVQDYRTRMSEIIDRAGLPHDLPPNQEAFAVGVTSGPKKPALVRTFTPMGYDCHGGSGTFTMQRRTPGNLTVEVGLDVGTWSNSLMAIFRVLGLVNDAAFKATLILPPARRATPGAQYPIGGPDRWQQIVDNLAALVGELDRTFVPAIEAASGPSPAWYQPGKL